MLARSVPRSASHSHHINLHTLHSWCWHHLSNTYIQLFPLWNRSKRRTILDSTFTCSATPHVTCNPLLLDTRHRCWHQYPELFLPSVTLFNPFTALSTGTVSPFSHLLNSTQAASTSVMPRKQLAAPSQWVHDHSAATYSATDFSKFLTQHSGLWEEWRDKSHEPGYMMPMTWLSAYGPAGA